MRDSRQHGLCRFCIERMQIAPRLNPESLFFCEDGVWHRGHCFVISPEARDSNKGKLGFTCLAFLSLQFCNQMPNHALHCMHFVIFLNLV